jgi:hypothetical protein
MNATCKKFLQVQKEGNREIKRLLEFSACSHAARGNKKKSSTALAVE